MYHIFCLILQGKYLTELLNLERKVLTLVEYSIWLYEDRINIWQIRVLKSDIKVQISDLVDEDSQEAGAKNQQNSGATFINVNALQDVTIWGWTSKPCRNQESVTHCSHEP